MPEADRVARAIKGCDFVVVSDIMAQTDTTRLAHVLLPATGWAEKDGTVTNSERRISRQRQTLPAAGEARDDWRILAEVGQRMGWSKAFGWNSPAEIFAEYAALSGVAGRLGSDFDISNLSGVTAAEYDTIDPFLWSQSSVKQGGRFFGDGQFHTADGKARMLAITPQITPKHPFRLNTGRVRDHWHTMTRTGLSPRLSRHLAEPFLEIHPQDAKRLNLKSADLAEITNPHGRAVLRVLVTDRVFPGHPFAPIHWTGETAPSGRIDALVHALTDPVSGQPASKSAPVSIRPFAAIWYGYAMSANMVNPDCDYWARATLPKGCQVELAARDIPEDWIAYAQRLFGISVDPLIVQDQKQNRIRLAFIQNEKLIAALFVDRQPVALSRSFLAQSLAGDIGADVLAGHPGADRPDEGPQVCACFGVGAYTIARAITEQKLISVDAIGKLLQAGTNCGSCKPELQSLLRVHAG